ncbi:NAD-dependent malic enzyme [Desulfoluna spongiiphila]|uniref:Malate dehydrogenase (Oxaloacetate-decarboxylating) n=1 Tax=Desulfoluna spongiiphila TaxID=419481 RepID=A0A1G5HW14_9BACT|nr:NAD-dependent malic enzyme [Desulfoluna spongiiphila]SCY67953.1 malate dehydrogenase (oxaloacetate-decarboxylating) [Desulfoluna spongiiphila]
MSIYDLQFDDYGNTRALKVNAKGNAVLFHNYTNKGVAFSDEEREVFEISGLVPPEVKSLSQQVLNAQDIIQEKVSDFEKFIYIRSLFDRNVTLAHALLSSDITRYMSIVYTPTVGIVCQRFSSMFRQGNGLHFYPGNIDDAEKILRRYERADIRVAVVTDNQGILGIGDQGAGGQAICLGKLMLYTQGAGIAPWHCLPISLDVGTDNEKLLRDPKYIGWHHRRLTGDDYLAFVGKFARAFKKVFPNALCQWEDFSKQNAFTVRDTYVNDLISFNDDIQGTGSVTLAGILAAMKIKSEGLKDQVYLIHGAGAGGVGIAEQIEAALVEEGMAVAEARARIFTLDSRGLVTTDRSLDPYKEKFAKDPGALPWFNSSADGALENVIEKAGVTVLIGTSGQHGCFTKEVVTKVLANTERPIILPLSNPTANTEAIPEDIYNWTDGKALVATGSPFDPVNHGGSEYRVGQCNNVFIFPGVGLGVIASGATKVLPSFFTAAAHAAADCVSSHDLARGALFPSVDRLQEVTLKVAKAVGRAAIREGVARKCAFSAFDHNTDPARLDEAVDHMIWKPVYLPLEA